MKVLMAIVAAFVFLSASMTAADAQESQVSETRFESRFESRFKPLRLDLVSPKKRGNFFLELGVMGSSGFRQKHGVHDAGFGVFLEGSYALWDGKYMALRPAVEFTVLSSLDNEIELSDMTTKKIDVLDFSGHGVMYVDFKTRWPLEPYIGLGGGYNYVIEDRSDNVEDDGGVAVLVGHVGMSWQIQKKGSWFLTLDYSYIYGFGRLFFETRAALPDAEEKIAVDSHRLRIGTRYAF